ncbi:MAG: hypothetical protein Ta2D_10520 [Rickettsiales bacterium]|nr:MAG: hypothetical protein Ta2D_10520 [Rickettsiales bacterium]
MQKEIKKIATTMATIYILNTSIFFITNNDTESEIFLEDEQENNKNLSYTASAREDDKIKSYCNIEKKEMINTDDIEIISNNLDNDEIIENNILNDITLSNSDFLLKDLEKEIKSEKILNNIEPNKISLNKITEFIKQYSFNFLPDDITIYPQTNEIGFVWTKFFDNGNAYMYLFIRETGIHYQSIIEKNGIKYKNLQIAKNEYNKFEIFMKDIENTIKELNDSKTI